MTLGEAEAAVSALEAAGIECTLVDDNIISVQWFNANAVGWVKVVVADEDVESASEVLSSQAVVEDSAAEREVPEPGCPRCGSTELHRVYYRRTSVLPMVLSPLIFLLVPLFLLLPRWKCDNCGRRVWVR